MGDLKVNEIKTDTIKNAAGTSAMTIDTSGNVSVKVAGAHARVDYGGPASYASISTGIIQFDNILENIGNHYNTSTYKFTCPVNGLYEASISYLAQNDTDKFGCDLYRADVRIARNYQVHRTLHATNFILCSAGDTLHWQLAQSINVYTATSSDPYSYASYSLIYAT